MAVVQCGRWRLVRGSLSTKVGYYMVVLNVFNVAGGRAVARWCGPVGDAARNQSIHGGRSSFGCGWRQRPPRHPARNGTHDPPPNVTVSLIITWLPQGFCTFLREGGFMWPPCSNLPLCRDSSKGVRGLYLLTAWSVVLFVILLLFFISNFTCLFLPVCFSIYYFSVLLFVYSLIFRLPFYLFTQLRKKSMDSSLGRHAWKGLPGVSRMATIPTNLP